MQQLSILVLKGCPCVGTSLCSLHVPSVSGERARSEVIMGHIFSWCLAAVVLVGDGGGDGGARDRATRCEPGLLLCLVVDSALSGVGLGPKVLEQKP